MEWLKDLKPLVDLGVPTALLAGVLYLLIRPPEWIKKVVNAHYQLSEGVRTMAEAMPKREEIQELLIGQEALRRETVEVKEELVELRRAIDGRPR